MTELSWEQQRWLCVSRIVKMAEADQEQVNQMKRGEEIEGKSSDWN